MVGTQPISRISSITSAISPAVKEFEIEEVCKAHYQPSTSSDPSSSTSFPSSPLSSAPSPSSCPSLSRSSTPLTPTSRLEAPPSTSTSPSSPWASALVSWISAPGPISTFPMTISTWPWSASTPSRLSSSTRCRHPRSEICSRRRYRKSDPTLRGREKEGRLLLVTSASLRPSPRLHCCCAPDGAGRPSANFASPPSHHHPPSPSLVGPRGNCINTTFVPSSRAPSNLSSSLAAPASQSDRLSISRARLRHHQDPLSNRSTIFGCNH